MSVCLLLLAAGAATRMRGGDKLLEPVEGVPVLRLLHGRGLEAGLDVRVTVPDLDHARAKAVSDLAGLICPVPDWREGMAASLRTGLHHLEAEAVLILPADMPEITAHDLARVASESGAIVQATAADGTPGHPVRFASPFFPELTEVRGDVGARSVLRAHADEVVRLALPDRHAVTDLDTPEAWADWRTRQTPG